MPERTMLIESPDTAAKIDFLGKYGLGVTLRLSPEGELHVFVMAADDRGTILIDMCVDVPEADEDTEEE